MSVKGKVKRLKCNPPIYKWLWFVISYEKGE